MIAPSKPDPSKLPLVDLLTSRYFPERGISHRSMDTYLAAVRSFDAFLGRESRVADLTAKNLAEFSRKQSVCFILRALLGFVERDGFTSQSPLALYFERFFIRTLGALVSPKRRSAYTDFLRLFDEFLSRRAIMADLNVATVSAFIAWLNQRKADHLRVAELRNCLFAFWRYASRNRIAIAVPAAGELPMPRRQNDVPLPSGEAQSCAQIGAKMGLIEYVETVHAVEESSAGAETIRLTILACRWLDAFLNRPPTLADLSIFVTSESAAKGFERFIVSHGRLPSTGRANIQRLFALWRAIVFRGHLPSNGKCPKLGAVSRPRRQQKGSCFDAIPTSERVARQAAIKRAVASAPRQPSRPAAANTFLSDFLLNYYVLERPLSEHTIKAGYNPAIRNFDKFLGRRSRIADLTAHRINAWIASLEPVMRPHGVAGYRRHILTLLRFAFETEVIDELPRRIRKVKLPRLVVEAWDSAQTAKLLDAADAQQGAFKKTGIERRLWWRAYILMEWYTGLRLSDVLAIKNSQIARMPDSTGRLSLVMQKTQERIDRLFPADAMAAIDALLASGERRDLILQPWVNRRFWYREFKALAKSAGLEGSSKWLRRGSASEAERIQPGAGRLHLGHRTMTVFQNNYRCDRIVQSQIVLPPAPSAKGGAT